MEELDHIAMRIRKELQQLEALTPPSEAIGVIALNLHRILAELEVISRHLKTPEAIYLSSAKTHGDAETELIECKRCKGAGKLETLVRKCLACGGTGEIHHEPANIAFYKSKPQRCSACDGSGQITGRDMMCPDCRGTGKHRA